MNTVCTKKKKEREQVKQITETKNKKLSVCMQQWYVLLSSIHAKKKRNCPELVVIMNFHRNVNHFI